MQINKEFYKKLDFWFGIGIILGLMVFWSQIPKIRSETAKVMPSIIIIGGWLCCSVIIIKTIFATSPKKPNIVPRKQTLILLGILTFVTLVLLSLRAIGMYSSLFLAISAVSLSITYIEHGMDVRKMIHSILYDVIVITVIFFLFNIFLKVNTPKGILL